MTGGFATSVPAIRRSIPWNPGNRAIWCHRRATPAVRYVGRTNCTWPDL